MNRSALALLVASAVSLPSGLPAEAGPPPPALLSRVELTGGTAGSATVRLTKPIPLDKLATTNGVAITGNATIATAILVNKTGGASAATLVFQYFKYGTRADWRAYPLANLDDKYVFPAGLYQLYLLADQPSTMTLQIGNQPPGRARIRATGRALGRAAVVPAAAASSPRPLPSDESHDTYQATKPFLVIGVVSFEVDAKHQSTVQSCSYDADPPAVTQGCAGGTLGDDGGGNVPLAPTVTPTYEVRVRYLRSATAKKLTYGLYYRTTSVPSAVHRWNIWLEV